MLSLGFPTTPPNTLRSAFQPKSFSSTTTIIGVRFPFPLIRTDISSLSPLVSLPKLRNCKIPTSASHGGGGGGKERERVMMEEQLPAGLRADLMPKHVALIMDGNRRWAVARDLPATSGHNAGHKALKEICRLCCKWKLQVLSVFAFSTENWTRPKEEVDSLMEMFEVVMTSQLEELMSYGIRVTVMGNRSTFSKSLQNMIAYPEETTAANSGTHLIVALNYSGKYDIIQACQSVATKVKDGVLRLEDINEDLIKHELESKYTEFPYPDLLIRTSGEYRLSNFMLWQLAYSELFFAKYLFPDFGETEFIEAISLFQNRRSKTISVFSSALAIEEHQGDQGR